MRTKGIELMEVVYEYCCGLDIHKKTVVACVVVPGAGNKPVKEIRTFNTMTADRGRGHRREGIATLGQ